jgi:hypothetical protein
MPALLTDRNAASGSPAMTDQVHPLDLLLARCCTLADRVARGELAFLDAVDMCWSASEFSGLVDRYGPDQIQLVLAAAFMAKRDVT